MFTGIIETTGEVIQVERSETIMTLVIRSTISSELRVDQSVAHNGVCLTVVATDSDTHTVQLVQETLDRSNFNSIKSGDVLNLERSMLASARFEGHIVQGHVDATGSLVTIKDGIYTFRYPASYAKLLVEKGSVCINGISLTVAALDTDTFGVAIIPYTLANTTFNKLSPGSIVNLEFDILAKHLVRIMDLRESE